MSILAENIKIVQLLHPLWLGNSQSWKKYRLILDGGQDFVRTFLRQFSRREDNRDFSERKAISYCPSFAKAALLDVRNAIAQRFVDISRSGGTDSYINAVDGYYGGVDMVGNSMSTYLATKILPELLGLGRVGIYIDNYRDVNYTLADKDNNKHPYLYRFTTEQIRSWSYDPFHPDKLLAVLLETENFNLDPRTKLTIGTEIIYRHLWLEDDQVHNQTYDQNGDYFEEEEILDLNEIPFVILELSDSLLKDIADYQIALLNLESSDINYILKSNFPFFTEQYDQRAESLYLKQPGFEQNIVSTDSVTQKTTQENMSEIEIGASAGRRYPLGTERPGFIHPSSEPLTASMNKEEQIKRDIRLLLNLAISNLQQTSVNFRNKPYDSPIEAGLVVIGAVLEAAERRLGSLWSQYEGSKKYPSITYPETYNLRNEEDRQNEADKLVNMISKVPSKTYQKELSKQIADVTIGHKVSSETLNKIKKEIDVAEVVISDPDIIKIDIENGLVGIDLASKIRGYPSGQVEAAKKDHMDRIARIALSQTLGTGKENETINNPESRGVSDLGTNKKSPKEEKAISRDKTNDSTPVDHVRGKGA